MGAGREGVLRLIANVRIARGGIPSTPPSWSQSSPQCRHAIPLGCQVSAWLDINRGGNRWSRAVTQRSTVRVKLARPSPGDRYPSGHPSRTCAWKCYTPNVISNTSATRQEMTTWLAQPDLDEVDIGQVLRALSDPVRLEIVRALDAAGEGSCNSLTLPVAKSTISHHLRTLREAGVIRTRLDGTSRVSQLRSSDLERRFPGLLNSVVMATPPVSPR